MAIQLSAGWLPVGEGESATIWEDLGAIRDSMSCGSSEVVVFVVCTRMSTTGVVCCLPTSSIIGCCAVRMVWKIVLVKSVSISPNLISVPEE